MENNSLQARRDKVIREHVEAENRHDVEAAIGTFHRPFYDVVAMGAVNDGAASVRDLLQGLFVGFPDFRASIGSTYHAADAVVVEMELTGTHKGPWAGVPPTGKSIRLRSAAIFKFDQDRLVGETVYFDLATLMRQLGAA
jgi:steroid delta-isomerase-like uncharacterized protein